MLAVGSGGGSNDGGLLWHACRISDPSMCTEISTTGSAKLLATAWIWRWNLSNGIWNINFRRCALLIAIKEFEL